MSHVDLVFHVLTQLSTSWPNILPLTLVPSRGGNPKVTLLSEDTQSIHSDKGKCRKSLNYGPGEDLFGGGGVSMLEIGMFGFCTGTVDPRLPGAEWSFPRTRSQCILNKDKCRKSLCSSGGSRILVRLGPAEFWLERRGSEPKICSKLPENCMILKKTLGTGEARRPWICQCVPCANRPACMKRQFVWQGGGGSCW